MQGITVRPMRTERGPKTDHSFILKSWLKAFKRSNSRGPIANCSYWKAYAETIEQIIERENVVVLMACPDTDQDQILAYAVLESGHNRPVIHWTYTKEILRNRGLMKLLVSSVFPDEQSFYYTFKTSSCKYLSYQLAYKPDISRKIPREKRQ